MVALLPMLLRLVAMLVATLVLVVRRAGRGGRGRVVVKLELVEFGVLVRS